MTDPKAEASDADAGNPQLPPVPKNEQFASLNKLRRERTWVDVFLIGGTVVRAHKRGGGKPFKSQGQSRPPQRTHAPHLPDLEEPMPPRRPPERAPVVIVKQRRSRSLIKPQ